MQFIEAEVDARNYKLLRGNISEFVRSLAANFDHPQTLALDIAPEAHLGLGEFFTQATIETLDIDPASGATYIADLCSDNSEEIGTARYDLVLCAEVLEHTLAPWIAVTELRRMVKPGGFLAVTVPFNFRIHGPSPDCWRFTPQGLRVLLSDFDEVEVSELPDPDRPMMPIHLTARARVR